MEPVDEDSEEEDAFASFFEEDGDEADKQSSAEARCFFEVALCCVS